MFLVFIYYVLHDDFNFKCSMTNFPCHPQIFERFTAMLAHPTIVFSSLHFTTKFKCAKTWLICSNTDFKIAHAKLDGGVLRAKIIFSQLRFSRNLKVQLLTSKSHTRKWVVMFLSYPYPFSRVRFRVLPVLPSFIPISCA